MSDNMNNQNNDRKYTYPTGNNYTNQNIPNNQQSNNPINSEPNKPYNPYIQQQPSPKEQAEQQAENERQKELKDLGKKLIKEDKALERRESIGTFFKRLGIVLLVLVLVGGMGVSIYFFAKGSGSVNSGGLIKLSISVTENLDNMSPIDQSISAAKIYPGDKFSVRCLIRNSDSIHGDNDSTGKSIFIRYCVKLIIDGVAYNNVVIPVVPNLAKDSWHIYNPEEEFEDYVWDGWYYYYGSLISDQSLSIFEEIQFDFHNTTNELGNKAGQIQISVEAVQADLGNIGVESGNAWNTAPRKWITNMQKHIDNNGNTITI